MLKNKRIFSFIVIVVLIAMQFMSVSFAARKEITIEGLMESLKKVASSKLEELSEDSITVSLDRNYIVFNINNKEYKAKYDLLDKIYFTVEFPVKKGISYAEFEETTSANEKQLLMLYTAVANMYGIKFEDSLLYYTMSSLSTHSGSFSFSFGDSVMVLDDINDNWTKSEDPSSNIFYASEFPNRVIEYVDKFYTKDNFYSYSDNVFNTYELNREKTSPSNSKRILKYEIIISKDAPWAFVDGYTNSLIPEVDIDISNVDQFITVNVGEKYTVQSDKKFTDISRHNYDGEVKFEKETNEITGIKPGIVILNLEQREWVDREDGWINTVVDEEVIYIRIRDKLIQKFSDVPTTVWSCEAVNALADGGVVSGVGQGRFSPDRGMKVSEFCQVLAKIRGFNYGTDKNGYWAGNAIKSCVKLGYVADRGEINDENYNEVITREEAIAAMQKSSGKTKIKDKNITLQDIPDGEKISAQYRQLILDAYNSGLTTGVNEQLKFSPKNQLTRAQVCQLFYNLNWTKEKAIYKLEQATNIASEMIIHEKFPEYTGIQSIEAYIKLLSPAIAKMDDKEMNELKNKYVTLVTEEFNNMFEEELQVTYQECYKYITRQLDMVKDYIQQIK